jgi:hypothetical protein
MVAPVFDPVILELLRHQDGVASRAQFVAAGARPHDLERWRRRRELVTVHPGVYLDHTGELTGRQRAWAAVLACGRAALWAETAIAAYEGTLDSADRPPLVAIDATRTQRPPVGARLRRVRALEDKVKWQLSPPRQFYDHAVVEVAVGRARRTDAVADLAAAVVSRRTTAERLLVALDARARCANRAWFESVVRDIGSGSCSVLEHAYVTGVERAHALPASTRQERVTGGSGVVYRDVSYGAERQLVELDGTLHERGPQRDRDLERDLDAALAGLDTRRLGWRQVVERPCVTAGKVARLLANRGWTGAPRPCSPKCSAYATFERLAG